MEALTDQSPLEYGKKHRGEKLANVPAGYLLWVHNEAKHVPQNILNYIADNYDYLTKEAEFEKNATKSPYGNR